MKHVPGVIGWLVCATNYVPPDELLETPIGEVDVLDPRYTLDQIAERTSHEIIDLYDPNPDE